jgi:hypothetical protein
VVQDEGIHVELHEPPLPQQAVVAPEPAPKQQQQQQPAAEEDPLVNVCISCDGCGQSPLVGTRYKYANLRLVCI